MCGIAGAFGDARARDVRAVEAMCGRMIARGPDDGGIVAVGGGGASGAMGNRRLAIVDLTAAGHQPMRDSERGVTLVFNGMIYNYRELRAELRAAGERFASECDTEVVLRAYGRWGAACVERLRGMFAFAAFDERTGALFVARDRLGIKPLYYRRVGGRLLFASQVKALLASGEVAARLSPEGVASFLAQGAVREPLTAIEGVLALPAGHTATYRDGELRTERYWTPPRAAEGAPDAREAARDLRTLLMQAVERHMVSDAPIGVFLSGGVDSTLLATLAAQHTHGLRTVSVAFDDRALSESRYMDVAAAHAGGAHERVSLDAREAATLLDGAFEAMDQPTFDGINTYVVSRAAADAGLKVALSGLGADELFDGYGHARRIRALERARRLPAGTRAAGARLAPLLAPLLARGANDEKLRAWLRGDGGSAHGLLRALFMPDEVARLTGERAVAGTIDAELEDPALLDLTGYLRDVLLRDADAMGMAHTVEVRVPYLDDAIVEHVLALPASARGECKALLLRAAGDLLPKEIIGRKKQGFVLPTASWMRGELREDVASALEDGAGLEMLDGDAVRDAWARFERDGRRWLRPWALYALSRWRRSLERAGALEVAA